MKRRRGVSLIDFLFIIIVSVCFIAIAGSHLNKFFYYEQPDVKAEIQLKQCAEKIGSGNRLVVVEMPVLDETKKLLKEEHYEVYKELKEEQKVIYKKSDKK